MSSQETRDARAVKLARDKQLGKKGKGKKGDSYDSYNDVSHRQQRKAA